MRKQCKAALPHELHRGNIHHSALGAMVTSDLFSTRVEKNKKGKGSYTRKLKHMGRHLKEHSQAISQ